MVYFRCSKCGKTVKGDIGLPKIFENELCEKGGLHSFSPYTKGHLKLMDAVKAGAVLIALIFFGAKFLKNLIVWFFKEFPVQSGIAISIIVILIVLFIISKVKKKKR